MKVKCKQCKRKFNSNHAFNEHTCDTAYMRAFATVMADKTAGKFKGSFEACKVEATRRAAI
jgi:hypothetical protein